MSLKRRYRRLSPTTRKRIEWAATLAASPLGFGLVLGDRHGHNWPDRGPWEREPAPRRRAR